MFRHFPNLEEPERSQVAEQLLAELVRVRPQFPQLSVDVLQAIAKDAATDLPLNQSKFGKDNLKLEQYMSLVELIVPSEPES